MTSGTPTEPNPHQIVQRVVPAARIVYADNDPVVLRYAEALLVSAAEGATDYLETDVREPRGVLQHACGFLDFERPVALPLVASLHSLGDEDDPYGVTRTLVDALPSGSLLVISHGTADFLDPNRRRRSPVPTGPVVSPRGPAAGPRSIGSPPVPASEESGFHVGVARVR